MRASQSIVPGLGSVTTLATAQAETVADTPACLLARRAHMKKAVDDGTDAGAAGKTFDAAAFVRLLDAAERVPGNACRTSFELEREQGARTWTSRYSARAVPTARARSR